MPNEQQIQHAKAAISGLGPTRALVRVAESDDGIELSIYDSLEDERMIVLEGQPFIVSDWPAAEKILALILGFRRTRDKINSQVRVERLVGERSVASGEV